MDQFPAGYKFHPSVADLVNHYLLPKVYNQHQPYTRLIHEVDFYQNGPVWFSENYRAQGVNEQGVQEWYFFTPRDKKYPNGQRPTRVAGNGFWRAVTGAKPIKNGNNANTRTLVYYYKRDGVEEKTNWIMKEFLINHESQQTIPNNNAKLDDCVLCLMYQSDHSTRITQAISKKRKKNAKEDVDKQQNVKRLQHSPHAQSSSLPVDIPINSVMPPLTIGVAPEQSSLSSFEAAEQWSPVEAQQELSPESKDDWDNITIDIDLDDVFVDGKQQIPNQQRPMEIHQQPLIDENGVDSSYYQTQTMENQQPPNYYPSYNHAQTMENQQHLSFENQPPPMENLQPLKESELMIFSVDEVNEVLNFDEAELSIEDIDNLLSNNDDEMEPQTLELIQNQLAPLENLQPLKENELMIFSVDEVNEVLNFDEAENKRELSIEDIDNLLSNNDDEMEPQKLEQIQNQLAPLENLQPPKENELMISSVDEVNEVLNFDEAENKRELSIEDIDILLSNNDDEMEPQTLEQIQNQLAPLENLKPLKENELMIFSVDEVNEVLNFDEAENKRELSIEDIDILLSNNDDEMEPQTLEQIQNQLAPLENLQPLKENELMIFSVDEVNEVLNFDEAENERELSIEDIDILLSNDDDEMEPRTLEQIQNQLVLPLENEQLLELTFSNEELRLFDLDGNAHTAPNQQPTTENQPQLGFDDAWP